MEGHGIAFVPSDFIIVFDHMVLEKLFWWATLEIRTVHFVGDPENKNKQTNKSQFLSTYAEDPTL